MACQLNEPELLTFFVPVGCFKFFPTNATVVCAIYNHAAVFQRLRKGVGED